MRIDFKKGDVIVHDIEISSQFVIYDCHYSLDPGEIFEDLNKTYGLNIKPKTNIKDYYITYFIHRSNNQLDKFSTLLTTESLPIKNNNFFSPKSNYINYLSLIMKIDNL